MLLALSKYDSTIEELRAAGQLPYSRFPLEYDKDRPFDMMLPHLAGLKSCAQVLHCVPSPNCKPAKANRRWPM